MPHYAFIIGVNGEWPEQRCTLGDIGLARCLANDCNIPKANIIEVYDERATRSNILRALENLLDRRNKNLATQLYCSLAKRRVGEAKSGNCFADGEEQHNEETDTLLLYYGGHGKRTEFCTTKESINIGGMMHKEPWIKHSEIIDLLERKFTGGTAWCIIDTCHSGGFGEAVVQRYNKTSKLNVNYGCIMSVAPYDRAGMEWSMTECLIRVFKGELLCSNDDTPCYLSTKKGKHPIKPTLKRGNPPAAGETKVTSHPTWEQVLEYLSDEMARIKGDRLTTLFYGTITELEKPCVFGRDINDNSTVTTNQTALIPRDDTWMEPFRRNCYSVNDGVYVKWVDPKAGHMGWYPGRIISISNDKSSANATTNGHWWSRFGHSHATSEQIGGNTPTDQSMTCIELYCVLTKAHWIITLPLSPSSLSANNVLGGLPFGFGFDPECCVNAITRMARRLAYFDTTVPPNLDVKVLWEDGKYYSAKTLHRAEVPWEEVYVESSLAVIGPCVPLRWEEDDSICFVPTALCVVMDTNMSLESRVMLSEKSSRDASEVISTPREAMLASLACERKQLQGDSSILGGTVTEEGVKWEAYDAEDKEWSQVHLMNKVELSQLPLKVNAYHMCYPESDERFSLIYWESDETLSIIPNSYLRLATAGDSNDDSSDDESDETTDFLEMRKHINETIWVEDPKHDCCSIH